MFSYRRKTNVRSQTKTDSCGRGLTLRIRFGRVKESGFFVELSDQFRFWETARLPLSLTQFFPQVRSKLSNKR